MSEIKRPRDKRIIKNLQDLEKLVELVKLHKIEYLEVEGIKLQKTRHEEAPMIQPSTKTKEEEDLETLFWSSN